MNRKAIFYSCLFTILICFSCRKPEVYYEFQEIYNANWSKSDTLYFDIDSSSIHLNVPFQVDIELINNTDYPYRNIWLYIQDDFLQMGLQKNEKQYDLADNYGKWSGSGFGSLYQTAFNYKKDIVFTTKRDYIIKIVHGMRDEPLYGIEKVGVKISSSQK